MKTAKLITVVDYGSFVKKREYYGSINQLMDILVSKQLEIYALVPTDSKTESPILDVSIRDIIPYNLKDLIEINRNLSERTKKITKCSDEKKFLVISSNLDLIANYESNNFTVCIINDRCSDLMSSNVIEIDDINKIKQLIN